MQRANLLQKSEKNTCNKDIWPIVSTGYYSRARWRSGKGSNKNVREDVLVAIVDFLYNGEANVFQENLEGG